MKLDRWDQRELDKLACAVRRFAGLHPEDIGLSFRIIHAVLGRDAYVERADLATRAALLSRGGFHRVLVRQGELDANFLTAHELAHYVLRRAGFKGSKEFEELFANYLAAAILVSPRALARVHRAVGEDLGTIAVAFQTTQSLIHRRLAEVLGDVRGIVRGAGEGAIDVFNHMPTAAELEFLAQCARHNRWPEIVRVYPMRGSVYDHGRIAFAIVA